MTEELGAHLNKLDTFLTKTRKELSQDGESTSFLNAEEFKPIIEAAISEAIGKEKTELMDSSLVIEGAHTDTMMAEAKMKIEDFDGMKNIKSRFNLKNDPKNPGSLETFYVSGESEEWDHEWTPEISINQALRDRVKPDEIDTHVKNFMKDKFGDNKEVNLFLEPGEDAKEGKVRVVVKDPDFVRPAPPSLAVIYEPPREQREQELAKLIFGINMTDVNARLENAGSEAETESLRRRKESLDSGGWEAFLQSAKDYLNSEEEYAKAEAKKKEEAKKEKTTPGPRKAGTTTTSGAGKDGEAVSGKEPTEDKSYAHYAEFKRTLGNLEESADTLKRAEGALVGVVGHDALSIRSEFPQPDTGKVFKFPDNMTVNSSSSREKFRKNEEYAVLAWKEFKEGSKRFREKYKNNVIGSRFDGEKRVNVTLADLESEVDKYFPEGGYKDVYTEDAFKTLANDKVRLLNVYVDFVKTQTKGKKINRVSFSGPLDEGTLFAKDETKPGDGGKPKDDGTPTEPPKPVDDDKEKKKKEKEYEGIFVLDSPRPGAKRYRLLNVDIYSDASRTKIDNVINLLAWETKKGIFVEEVGWDGKRVEGAKTYMDRRVFKDKGRREKGRTVARGGEVRGLDFQFDDLFAKIKKEPNQDPKEWKVVLAKENDQTSIVRVNDHEIRPEKVEEVWKYVLNAKVKELNPNEIGLMRRDIFDLFPLLQKMAREIKISTRDKLLLKKIEDEMYEQGENLDTFTLLKNLKKYGEVVGLKF